jgi:hypothetical protein
LIEVTDSDWYSTKPFVLGLFLMTLNAESLAVAEGVWTTLVQRDDVVYFQIVFGIRLFAFFAGELISLEDVESSLCSSLSFEAVSDWLSWCRYSNCFHTSGSS